MLLNLIILEIRFLLYLSNITYLQTKNFGVRYNLNIKLTTILKFILVPLIAYIKSSLLLGSSRLVASGYLIFRQCTTPHRS